MKRYMSYLFTTGLGLVLIFLALSNRAQISISLLPPELNYFETNLTINLPIFMIFFLGLIVGTIIGFFWEWLRGHAQRSKASINSRELKKANEKIKQLKSLKYEGSDDLISILDNMK